MSVMSCCAAAPTPKTTSSAPTSKILRPFRDVSIDRWFFMFPTPTRRTAVPVTIRVATSRPRMTSLRLAQRVTKVDLASAVADLFRMNTDLVEHAHQKIRHRRVPGRCNVTTAPKVGPAAHNG